VNWAGDGGTVTWTLSHTDLPATMGSPITRTVNVTIQQVTNNGTGATAGNTITIMDSTATQKTTTHLVFNDGTNTHTIGTTKLTQFTVAQASGAYLAITTSALNGNPGDSLTYTFTLRNGGNATNTFNLTQVKSGGNYDTVHVFHLTMGGPSITNTGSVPAGSTITLYVGLYVNVTGVNDSTIIRLLTASPTAVGAGTPLGAGNYNASITVTTTVTAPNLSIVLSQSYISGVGTITNPAPGDVIEYTLTITNGGLGTATNLSTSNAIPNNTTFLPNSYGVGTGIMVGAVAKTNIVDGDNASEVGNVVSVTGLTVNNGGGSIAIKYQVSVH